MLLETGIVISQAIWLWRVRHIRREAKMVGKTYDEYVAEHPKKILPRSQSSETVLDVEAGHEHQDRDSSAEKRQTEAMEAVAIVERNQEKPATSRHSLLQKWRSLVLQPASEPSV